MEAKQSCKQLATANVYIKLQCMEAKQFCKQQLQLMAKFVTTTLQFKLTLKALDA